MHYLGSRSTSFCYFSVVFLFSFFSIYSLAGDGWSTATANAYINPKAGAGDPTSLLEGMCSDTAEGMSQNSQTEDYIGIITPVDASAYFAKTVCKIGSTDAPPTPDGPARWYITMYATLAVCPEGEWVQTSALTPGMMGYQAYQCQTACAGNYNYSTSQCGPANQMALNGGQTCNPIQVMTGTKLRYEPAHNEVGDFPIDLSLIYSNRANQVLTRGGAKQVVNQVAYRHPVVRTSSTVKGRTAQILFERKVGLNSYGSDHCEAIPANDPDPVLGSGQSIKLIFGSRYLCSERYTGQADSAWRHSYSDYIHHINGVFKWYRPDGDIIQFEGFSASSIYPNFVISSLSANAKGYAGHLIRDTETGEQRFFDLDGRLRHYSNANAREFEFTYTPDGLRMTKIQSQNSALILAYDSHGNLSRVTDRFGRFSEYEWETKTVEVADAGRSQSVNVITQIMYADNDADASNNYARRFAYNDAHFPFSITNIYDLESVGTESSPGTPQLYASFTYDDNGKAISSSLNGGRSDTVTYAGGNVVQVKNELGKTTSYTYDDYPSYNGPVQRLKYVIGEPTNTCVRGQVAYDYDTHGRIKTIDDNGVITERLYASNGQLEKEIQAKGTTLEQSVDYEWHPTLNVPYILTYPDRVETMVRDANGNLTQFHVKDLTEE